MLYGWQLAASDVGKWGLDKRDAQEGSNPSHAIGRRTTNSFTQENTGIQHLVNGDGPPHQGYESPFDVLFKFE